MANLGLRRATLVNVVGGDWAAVGLYVKAKRGRAHLDAEEPQETLLAEEPEAQRPGVTERHWRSPAMWSYLKIHRYGPGVGDESPERDSRFDLVAQLDPVGMGNPGAHAVVHRASVQQACMADLCYLAESYRQDWTRQRTGLSWQLLEWDPHR